MMTRKHFQAIADTLASLRPIPCESSSERQRGIEIGRAHQWETAMEAMADMCARENPRFDRGRFFRACNAEDIV